MHAPKYFWAAAGICDNHEIAEVCELPWKLNGPLLQVIVDSLGGVLLPREFAAYVQPVRQEPYAANRKKKHPS